MPHCYVGTAGWTLPRAVQHAFPGDDAHLARCARVLDAAEINASFQRTPRASTYARWAGSVPPSFRFAVKMPRAITHERGLEGAQAPLAAFMASIAPLEPRLGCLLVQLPPSLALIAPAADAFFAALRAVFAGDVALEPRHPSWFDREAGAVLAHWQIGRVAADPPRGGDGLAPLAAREFAYWRLHGSPRTYYSAYTPAFLEALAGRVQAWCAHAGADARAWCIFDNTASGAAAADALALQQRLQAGTR
jgi:uncharacterized protein YecE (DUF72 family)